ncbi:MAG: hypothetical protein K6T78_12655 [Alicyclobacillus sp.]|nr:hypothetical protein [Alicyclobacillus sp.]
MGTDKRTLYATIVDHARHMLALGERALSELRSAEERSGALPMLHHRALHYVQIEQMVASGLNLQWHEFGVAEPSASDGESGMCAKECRDAQEMLQSVLLQNAQLESALAERMAWLRQRTAQVEQQQRLEQTYHPVTYTTGVRDFVG